MPRTVQEVALATGPTETRERILRSLQSHGFEILPQSSTGQPIDYPFRSFHARLDEDTLKAIADLTRGEYFRALERNSAAYAPILEVDETPARRARAAGAVAAGITGAGPAILALVKPAHVESVARALDDGEAEVRVASLNTVESREVTP